MIFDFDEREASVLADILMDYSDGAPEDALSIQKLFAARYAPQDFTESELLLILARMKDYFADTAERLTPAYDSPPFSSPATSGIFSERETISLLRERLLRGLSPSRPES